jgi:hypothetical protein
MTWAWDQDAQANALLVLLAYADESADDGTYQIGDQEELAAKTGLTSRSVSTNAGKLEGAGLLRRHPRYEAGRRIKDVVKLGVDGTLDLPEDISGTAALPEKSSGGDLQGKGRSATYRKNLRGASSSTPTNRDSEGRRSARQNLPLVSDRVPDSMRTDADALLHRKTKVGDRLVTPEEMALAAGALAEFNRLAGYDYGLGAHLKAIVGRIRERPRLGAAEYLRLAESAWRLRWWERNGKGRRPTPAVIYGNAGVFEQVIADASDEKAGREQQPARKKRFERKGPRIGSPERPI